LASISESTIVHSEPRARLALSSILLVGVGIPALSAYATGAIDIPHNDDWAYSRIALGLADDGHIHLVGWNQPSLIGHLIWAQPFLALFGHSLAVLHVAQSLAAAAGLVFAYLVAREFVSCELSLLATALLAAFPGYALLAPTYMTDTTAFTAQMGCLLFGLRALRRGRGGDGLLVASLLLGVYGFTIREIALAAPLGVLAGRYAAVRDRKDRAVTIGAVLALLAFAAAFFIWRHSLPGDEKSWLLGDASYYERVEQVARAYFTLAFAVSPLFLVALRFPLRSALSRTSLAVGAGVLVLGAITIVRGGGAPLTLFSGNSLTRVGAVDVTLPGRPVLFSRPVWGVMTFVALLAGVVLAILLTRICQRALSGARRTRDAGRSRGRSEERAAVVVLTLYAGLTITVLMLRAAAGTSGLYDRYLWGIGLVLVVLLGSTWADAPSRRSLLLVFAGTAVLATVSLAVAFEEQASSAERWNAGEVVVSNGEPSTSVDAGFEWMGWYYPYVVGSYDGPARWRQPASWYNVLEFPASANCTLMSYSPRRERWLQLVRTRSYRPFVLFGRRTLYVYRNPPACDDLGG
jgi:hypothetical protein